CADCEEEKEGECPYHPLFLILDNPVVRDGNEKDRARLTTPWPLTVYDSKVKGAGKGVWTNAHLPAHLVFGPYEGRVLSGHPEAGKESGYGWKIRGTGTRNRCIDAVDSAVSNWMRYVNCSRTEAETNLSTFQYKGQIYYKTDSAISRGSELMCWYGDDYGKDLGLSREPSKWKPAEDVKDRQCEWCGLVYSSKDYLTRHLKVCRKRVHTYTPPIFSTRGTSSSSGSTKQCLREEAPQFPEKAFHETLRSPASDEYNSECSRRGVGRRGRRRVSRPARTRARDPRRRPPVTPRPVLAGSENRTTPPVSLADGFPSLPPLVPPGQASRTACMVPPDGSQRPPPSPPPPYDAHMSRLPMSASAPPLYYGATEAPYSALPPYNSSHGGGASKDSSAKAPFSGSREPLVPPQAGQTVIVVDNATLRPGTCVVCRKGQMKESASQWTWVACLLLLPLGVVPGIIAFCCCFRRPKCTSCGYAV
ncbi:putative histone-lysine N-methyltransferase PRDM7, partial [Penaeus vannamei]